MAFVVIALVVLALAGYLITIALILKKVSFTLGTVIIGVRAIANQTAPVGEVVGDIATNVISIQNALRGVLGLAPATPSRGVRATPRASLAPPAAPAPVAAAPMPARRAPDRRTPIPAAAAAPAGGTGPVSMRRR
ncbi:MAG: hypothetical protein ACRDWV_09290 [Acidimicrobiales bacterium]